MVFQYAIFCAILHRQQVIMPGCGSFSIVIYLDAQKRYAATAECQKKMIVT
jgi:hypothetical protein